MHPEIETFLDEAFQSVQPSSPAVGRVVVEPDYEVSPSQEDAQGLRNELVECIREQSPPDAAALSSHDGFEVSIPARYGLLKKYVLRVTLHQDKLDGSWVEIVPPGNWI